MLVEESLNRVSGDSRFRHSMSSWWKPPHCWAFLVLLACCFARLARAQVTDPLEVNALRAIRSSLVDSLNKLENWNSGDPCTSNWTGIVCTAAATDNGYLHIRKLVLLSSNLSGSLAPEIGSLSQLEILDFMWNNISGGIPPEIGNITSLRLLLLNGNKLSGSLPIELGNLVNMVRIQIDENQISGPIPKSFANLNNTRHFHMNNNSLSGQIPLGFYRLESALHLLLDNNNLSGYLPEDISTMPSLEILQLDNNNFSGTSIPLSYTNISTLQKLSLRNCSLQGSVPDLSPLPQLTYIDLSWNQLAGLIPPNRLSDNITTIDLSSNFLDGYIPSSFSDLPNLQLLSLENNKLTGSVPPFWKDINLKANQSLILNFQNNLLTNFSTIVVPPPNTTILLYGNPVCTNASLKNSFLFCQPQTVTLVSKIATKVTCNPCPTDLNYEHNPNTCICAIPFGIGYRLKSPSMSDFRPYITDFDEFLTSHLDLALDQLDINSYAWEEGPRLRMYLKVFPNDSSLFEPNEVLRITRILDEWQITLPGIFGPYELLNFTFGYYASEFPNPGSSLSKTAIIGIVLGALIFAASVSAVITVFVMRKIYRARGVIRKKSSLKVPIRIDGVKGFTIKEMALATNDFSSSSQVGEGGYGKVYKGTLDDGTVVAIKRVQEGSLQGSKEFFTEIELLSRLHHRNLVSLVGYCNEEEEQMLVYEFMHNGSLRDQLSAKSKVPLSFSLRLRIALGSARGILYLHNEVDPPIFHRDIKASNILLDSKYIAKVADFGLSRLAPIPNFEGRSPEHVSTVVKGTPGYLDPEYFLTHKLTDKSDVYSLGVVFLELLTGLQPISKGKNIVREVNMVYRMGKVFSIIDCRMGAYPSDCVEKLMTLALRCCQDETDSRPSMSNVVRELESIWKMMPQADILPSDSIVCDAPLAVSSSSSVPESRDTTVTTYTSSMAFTAYDTPCGDISHAISTINPR